MQRHIFREYDIRGLVDKDLTEDVAHKLGLGLGTTVRRKGGKAVVLGRDCRESSDRFRDAMLKGLTSTGIDVVDIGVVPTPVTYFAANTLPDVHGLAMITGSLNPKEYNGFKMGAGKTTFHGHEIQALRELIEKGDFEKGSGKVTPHDIVTPYQDYVRKTVKVGRKGMKIVVDAGTGDMSFYLMTSDDPVAATWARVFPELFRPGAEMAALQRAELAHWEPIIKASGFKPES